MLALHRISRMKHRCLPLRAGYRGSTLSGLCVALRRVEARRPIADPDLLRDCAECEHDHRYASARSLDLIRRHFWQSGRLSLISSCGGTWQRANLLTYMLPKEQAALT